MESNQDPGSPQRVIERAEQGKEILGATVARGEPGTKQPAHDDPRLSASKTVEQLDKIAKDFESETYKSSDERAKEGGNLNPVAPQDRTTSRGPQVLAGAATAAGAIGAARDALTTQLESDARLTSDPRYERDQKVYELGQTGKLGGIARSPVETALLGEGMPEGVAEALPKTPEEQVADDMQRLNEVERRPQGVLPSTVRTSVDPGVQDSSEKNNGLKAEQEGRTGEAAVARAKAADLAQASAIASTPGKPVNVEQPKIDTSIKPVPDAPTPIRSDTPAGQHEGGAPKEGTPIK